MGPPGSAAALGPDGFGYEQRTLPGRGRSSRAALSARVGARSTGGSHPLAIPADGNAPLASPLAPPPLPAPGAAAAAASPAVRQRHREPVLADTRHDVRVAAAG